ncbi:MAG: tRNA (adenosine(37)-N6)-dimethylallyltransferase MiaA [Planctomycetota bacterium]
MSAPWTVVVTGPTCGGKTGLSTALARATGWPILSLDAMKVYRGMDIGSAKPSAELRSELRFELLDLRDPWETFSVSDYLEEWKAVSERIAGPRILSGGTLFYLNALREGLFEGPGADPATRERWEARADAEGTASLHRHLCGIDPIAAARIHPTDRRRLIRAIEVFESSGETLTAWQARREPSLDPERTIWLGISRPREALHARIEARVLRMFDAGWVAEVEGLLARREPPWSSSAAQSIGYEVIRERLLAGEDPRGGIERIQSRTRAFARRQLTWARKLPIEWWTPEEFEERGERLIASLTRGELPTPDPEARQRGAAQ